MPDARSISGSPYAWRLLLPDARHRLGYVMGDKQEAKSGADERPAIEREVERLEGAIARLTDAIEAGQPVGDRLKQRQAELDTLRAKLAEPETFDPDREQFEVELARWIEPLRWTGPVVSERDPQQTRSAMRHLGMDKIIVTPEADGGWSFAGVGDLARLVGRKGVSPLPPTPPPLPEPHAPRIGAQGRLRRRSRRSRLRID